MRADAPRASLRQRSGGDVQPRTAYHGAAYHGAAEKQRRQGAEKKKKKKGSGDAETEGAKTREADPCGPASQEQFMNYVWCGL